MKIELLTKDLYEAYTAFLLHHPHSLFYYSTPYKDFLENLLNCTPHYLIAHQEGDIRGVLPLMIKEGPHGKVVNSLPYYGSHGGILSHDPEATHALVQEYNYLISQMDVASATVVVNLFEDHNASIKHNMTDQRIGQVTDIGCLSDFEDEIFKRISGNKRNEIRRAQRHGIEVVCEPSQLNFIREAHQEEMREMGRTYKNDLFFDLVPQFFQEDKNYKVYVASLQGKRIAGLLVFFFHDTVEYFTPVTLKGYRTYQPMPLILFHVMRDAMREGYKFLNWGGTWVSQEGVYRFKNQMGAKDYPYTYYTQLNHQELVALPKEDVLNSYENFYVYNFNAPLLKAV